MRRARGTIAVLATVGALVALAAPGAAHADLVSATPRPGSERIPAPAELVLVFSEPLEDRYTRVQVVDREHRSFGEGHRIEPDRTRITVPLAPLPDGVYIVLWRTLSVDTHTLSGSYLLAVNTTIDPAFDPGAHTDHGAHAGAYGGGPSEGLVRAAGFAAASVAAGVPLFLLFLRPVFVPPQHRRTLRLWAAGAAFAATVAFVVLLQFMGTRIEADWREALATSTGTTVAWRAAAFAGAGAVLAGASLSASARQRRPLLTLGAGLAVAGLVLTSMSGHAAARVEGRTLAIAADAVHLAAVAFWIGGVGALIFLLPGAADPRVAAAWVRRFSPAAMAAVAVIIATGTYASLLHLDRVGDLGTSSYGKALSTKILLMRPLLALGWHNRYRLTPRIEAGDPHGIPRLRRAATAEALLMAIVLGAAGLLANTAPPGTLASQAGDTLETAAFVASVEQDGYNMTTRIAPAPVRIGTQNVTVIVVPLDGALPERAAVFLRLYPPSDPAGEGRVVETHDAGGGTWHAEGALLNEPGPWRVQVLLQGRGTYVTHAFDVDVAAF